MDVAACFNLYFVHDVLGLHAGTPRMEYAENLIDGVRLRPTFNPYVKLTKAKRYVLDNWPSR